MNVLQRLQKIVSGEIMNEFPRQWLDITQTLIDNHAFHPVNNAGHNVR